MTRARLAILGLLGAMAAAVPTAAAAAAPPAPPAPRTPIRHFVVLMQENRSFDHYFGTYPKANGIPPGACVPTTPGRRRPCVKPFHLAPRTVPDLGHDSRILQRQYALRDQDGFAVALSGRGGDARLAVGHYDRRDIPYYWNVADRYVLFDRFFAASALGGISNRMFWITGTPGDLTLGGIPPGGYGTLPTIFDRLQQRGLSWRMYVQSYDPRITSRTRGEFADRALQVTRAPLLAYSRYIDDPKLSGHIVDLSQYYDDLAHDRLPAVSYIVPWGASEHPPGSPQAGERFVRSLITALERSGAWASSAFLWTYDDWGGWYDHVLPPRRDASGDGFRVPALLVSPYARAGVVDHTSLDITSALRFIEQNWGLRPLAARDATANSIDGAFDFRLPPRAPVLLSATPGGAASARPDSPLIYGAYATAVAVALAVLAAAAIPRPSRARTPGREPRRGVSGRLRLALAGAALGLATLAPGLAAAAPATLSIQTAPAVGGVRFSLEGHTATSDAAGRALLPVSRWSGLADRIQVDGTHLGTDRRARLARWAGNLGSPRLARQVRAVLELSAPVTLRFTDPKGRVVDPGRISAVRLASSHGAIVTLRTRDLARPTWLPVTRVRSYPFGNRLEARGVSYTVRSVIVDGANVVRRGQQRFVPGPGRRETVRVLFYSASLWAEDAFFHQSIGSHLILTSQDGKARRFRLEPGGHLVLASLPRGEYTVKADTPGLGFTRSFTLSRDTEVPLQVISDLDLAILLLGLGLVVLGLAVARRALRRRETAAARPADGRADAS